MAQQVVRDERSIGQILKDLTHELQTLFRQEVELAKTEMGEKASRVGTNVGAVAAGGAVAFAGALALLAALVRGFTILLEHFMSPNVAEWLSPLLLGVVLAAIGLGMMKKAIAALKHETVTPEKTTQSLQENKEWLKTRFQ
jgi:xanthine/uracil permease